jgi:hypothetical protein
MTRLPLVVGPVLQSVVTHADAILSHAVRNDDVDQAAPHSLRRMQQIGFHE